MQFKSVCVLGLGYIGLPTASMFATHGVRVMGVDVDASIVSTLQKGEIHIHEPGLRSLVQEAVKSGNLQVSTHPEPADAFIIAVPTPIQPDKSAEMAYVISATEAVVPYLRQGNLVVLESTSPPRTTVDLVRPILERSGLKAGVDFHLAYSPERVLPGQIIRELVENDRVIGGVDEASSIAGKELYSVFVKGEIILTDATSAEMVKLMENTYRDVNIAIANEFARLADRFGTDVWETIQIANRHPRVKILRPGPGVGGHCISVDPWFLVQAAPDITPLIQASRQVNDHQPHVVFEMVKEMLGDLAGRQVAALGLAFKPDVDDLRESPAIEVCQLLSQAGALVRAYEPYKPNASLPGVVVEPTLEGTLRAADLVLVLVAHAPFKEITPAYAAKLVAERRLLDTVNHFDHRLWREQGFVVARLGVRKSGNWGS